MKEELELCMKANPFLKVGDWIYERLYKDILTLKMLPGTKINESKLALEFGLSRSPVKGAINRLIEQELVIKDGRKLPVVAPVHKKECRFLYEARTALEGHAAFLAAKRITKSELNALWRLFKSYETSIKKITHTYAEQDHAFHLAIMSAARNPRIMDMYAAIEGRILRYRRYTHIAMPQEIWFPVMSRAVKHHKSIYLALHMGFGDLARSEIEQDISGMLHVFTEWD